MSARSTRAAETASDRLRCDSRRTHHSRNRRRPAGHPAGLPADLAAQRRGEPAHAHCRRVAVLPGPSGAGLLPVHRRSQHRLHRAQHLRRLHHERVLDDLHRARTRDRPADAGLSAFLSRDVPDHDVRHEPRVRLQQYRPDVGGGRAGDPHHRADGRHLSHPRGARGGVEILHPRQRRHRARAVRHHPGLHGGAAGRRRGHSTRWSGPC